MTEKLANIIKNKYDIECGYFSVLNSDDPNYYPFYNSYHLDNHMHYNIA